jgi:hypothetical protein
MLTTRHDATIQARYDKLPAAAPAAHRVATPVSGMFDASKLPLANITRSRQRFQRACKHTARRSDLTTPRHHEQANRFNDAVSECDGRPELAEAFLEATGVPEHKHRPLTVERNLSLPAWQRVMAEVSRHELVPSCSW